MTGKQYGALLGAVVLAACTLAGCGSSSDSSSGKAQSAAQEPASKKDTSGTDTAKTADSGEKQEAAGGKEEVIETGETYSYFVAGAELEIVNVPIVVRCPKCGVYLSYVVKDGKVTIEFTEERKDVKHIKYYGKQVGQAGQ